jgi:hypothetical protein
LRITGCTMSTKLTLSMDESVIERAKQAARARNTSVSAMLAGLVPGLDALDHPCGADFIGPPHSGRDRRGGAAPRRRGRGSHG